MIINTLNTFEAYENGKYNLWKYLIILVKISVLNM